MSYAVGNYYAECEIRTVKGRKQVRNVFVRKLEHNLGMGGYVWSKNLYFNSPQEAVDFIHEKNPKQRFHWESKDRFNSTFRTVDDSAVDCVKEAWSLETYQVINGTDYLVDIKQI